MKLKRKTPSGLFPSPYKTKYTRYPIHFYISIITKTLLRGLQKGFYHPAELMMARDSSGTI